MSNFSYEEYAAQQAAKLAANGAQGGEGGNSIPAHYLNEYLRNDGDTVVIRFPYHSMNDLTFTSTHVLNAPNSRYGMRLGCEGPNCEFCAAGEKLDMRCFIKCLAYMVDEATGKINIINCVWDRPAVFADTQIKPLFQEYGDISTHLFKVRRTGSAMQTRYNLTIILNNAVYNPDIYKADFTELNQIDAARLCLKSKEKYKQAISGTNESKEAAPVTPAAPQQPAYQQPQQAYTQPAQVQQQPAYAPQPAAYTTTAAPAYQPPINTATMSPQPAAYTAPAVESAPQQPVAGTVDPATGVERTQRRYTF